MYYQHFYMKTVQHPSFKLKKSHPLHDVIMFRVDREALFHILIVFRFINLDILQIIQAIYLSSPLDLDHVTQRAN